LAAELIMSDTTSDLDCRSGLENQGSLCRVKKATTTFLLTTYRMLEDKENSSVIRWQRDGNSFVIANIEEFVKILPRYFKTKNYSSFVRQLNLYNFHKIKNQEGLIEFGHEQFRRGAIENLQFITRKINQDSEAGRQKLKSQKPMSFEYNRLLGIIRNLENSLRVANTKNDALQMENQRLNGALEEVQRNQDRHTRTLLYILWVLTSSYEPIIQAQLQEVFRRFEMEGDSRLFQCGGVAGLRQILEESRILGFEKTDALLEALLQFAVDFHNSRPQNAHNKIQIDSLAVGRDNNLDWLQRSVPPSLLRGNSCAKSDLFPREASPLKRYPSIADLCEESPEFEELDDEAMELETSSHVAGTISRRFGDEPESIFPEHVFLYAPLTAGKVSG